MNLVKELRKDWIDEEFNELVDIAADRIEELEQQLAVQKETIDTLTKDQEVLDSIINKKRLENSKQSALIEKLADALKEMNYSKTTLAQTKYAEALAAYNAWKDKV